MSLDIETIIDRRRLKRRLSLWRLAALVALGLVLLALLPNTRLGPTGDHVARVTLSGIIVDDRAQQDLIREIGEDDNAKALLLYIDSPGGTTTGSEALFETIRKVSDTKPVVAVLGTVAASGGYIAALSADHIVSRGNTITGSIGVLAEFTKIAGLMETLGVEVDIIRSAPLKAQPNMYEDTPEAATQAMQDMINASYVWFIGLVVDRRGMDEETARTLGDGRVFTGWQALENGLVDAIGGEEVARSWLADEHDVDSEIPTEDWSVSEETNFSGLTGQALGHAIATAITQISEKTLSTKGLTLDGLVSVWQPQAR